MKLSLVLPICLSFAIISQAAPMNFDKRRFGVEHTPEADALYQEVKDLAQGSDKEAQAGNLSGAMVRALLAKAPACDQQDRADEVIDLGRQFGGKTEEQYIEVAKKYRQLERNTPGEGQPSELCDKAPKNKELEGLTQAQDPTGKGKENPVEDPEKEDPEKEDPEKEDPEKEDPEKEDPEKEDPEKEDPEKEDPEKEDPEKEDPEKEDPEKEDPEKEDPEKEDPEKEDPEKEDPEKEDPEKEDPEKEDPETGEQNVAETNPVGGVKMPKIEQKDDDFIVNGNGFNGNLDAAHSRQCDIQKNLCFNKFNGGDKSFSGQDCEDQVTACKEGPPVFA